MTQTTQPRDRRPTDILLNLLVALLAPMFLDAADGDIAFASIAALETIAEYRPLTQSSLLRIAKIIAFNVATLASLSQSMQDDLPIPLILRLRSNANALDRSAERNERALNATRPHAAPVPDPESAAPEPPPVRDKQHDGQAYRTMWAKAMAEVAAEETAALDTLPPAERKDMTMRIAALNSAAATLRSGDELQPPQPGDLAWMTPPPER